MIFFRKYWYFTVIILIVLFLFYPSFSNFFTHDDFFHLYISRANSLGDILDFFNLYENKYGYGSYRPLSTQLFYFMGTFLFNRNSFYMHLVSFSFFIGILILIYKLARELSLSDSVSRYAVFFFATSSAHFMNLYFLGAFQEVASTFFILLTVLFYLKTIKGKKINYFFSLGVFVLSLTCKETAVVTPFLIIIVISFIKLFKDKKWGWDKICKTLPVELKDILPFFLILFLYLYFRFFHYGFAKGDSYTWDFSLRVFNSLFWYVLWSFNLPEMLVDFVGPGFNVNPNLFRYWFNEITPIFLISVLLILYSLFLLIRNFAKVKTYLLFSLLWFLISLSPVIFLPYHKFAYYLTLPLFGFTLIMGYLLSLENKKFFISLFLFFWILSSYKTLGLTKNTHWVTRGSETAKRVDNYFKDNEKLHEKYTKIVFIDTEKDSELPWKPSKIVKESLSDNNYFNVFYPGKFKVYYGNEYLAEDFIQISARQFIGY